MNKLIGSTGGFQLWVTIHFDKNNLIQAAKYTPALILQDRIQILTNYAIFGTKKETGDTGNLDRRNSVDKSFTGRLVVPLKLKYQILH